MKVVNRSIVLRGNTVIINRKMYRNTRSLLGILISAILIAACATPQYWIPPSSAALLSGVSPESAIQNPGSQVDLDETLVAAGNQEAQPGAAIGQNQEPEATRVRVTATPNQDNPTLAPVAEPAGSLATTATPVAGNRSLGNSSAPPILYEVQAADTLHALTVRFDVTATEITSDKPLVDSGFLAPGQLLIIPRKLTNTTSPKRLIPDSEVVFSPSAVDFDVENYVKQAGGKLSTYFEWLKNTGVISGAEVVMRVALDNSINPRLLLSLIEYHSNWVYDQPANQDQKDYPLGKVDPNYKGLYRQLVWTVNQLSIGYYAYREGRLTEIEFPDGVVARLAPELNAGSAALHYYFAQLFQGQQWADALDPEHGYLALYTRMFGNAWERAHFVEPLFPPGLAQPALILPFQRNWRWSYTGGPHGAWEHDGAYAALDFAPGGTEVGCKESEAWVLAAAAGLVVRTDTGLIVLDLDGDGREQTGWTLIYLHVANATRVPIGKWVDAGDLLGHPSCEGGISTGTHVHLTRKYNGEWIPASGALPFNLGGWIAHAGDGAYKGTMTRAGDGDLITTIVACTCANAQSFITRTDLDP